MEQSIRLSQADSLAPSLFLNSTLQTVESINSGIFSVIQYFTRRLHGLMEMALPPKLRHTTHLQSLRLYALKLKPLEP